jgi:hypothetical protein
MRIHGSRLVTVFLAGGASACARSAPQPPSGYWVSSDSSQYSPVVRVHIVASQGAGGYDVVLDTGTVEVPGVLAAASPVMMHDLYITAYVATPNAAPVGLVRDDPAQFADRRGWRAVAQSDSVLLASQLRFGEERTVPLLRLRLVNAPTTDHSHWLVLGVSGQSVDLRIPFDESSGLRPGGPGIRRLQVYACSDRDLDGQIDTARSKGMRRAYGLLC